VRAKRTMLNFTETRQHAGAPSRSSSCSPWTPYEFGPCSTQYSGMTPQERESLQELLSARGLMFGPLRFSRDETCGVCEPGAEKCTKKAIAHVTNTDGSVNRWRMSNECFGRELPYGTPICRYAVNKLRRFQYRDKSARPAGKFTLQIVAGVPEDISICIKTCRNHTVHETTEIGAMVRSSDIFRFRIPGDLKGVLADICFLAEGAVVANYADRILLDTDDRSRLINVTVRPSKIQHIEGNKNFPCRVVQKPDPLAVTMLDIKLDPLGSRNRLSLWRGQHLTPARQYP